MMRRAESGPSKLEDYTTNIIACQTGKLIGSWHN